MNQEKQDRIDAQVKAKNKGCDHLPRLLEDIKVAVIDDGIDGFQADLIENIASGISYCKSSDAGNLLRAYYVPSGSHGTMMARLICRVCPKVKLYIARLDEHKAPNEKRLITAQSAEKVSAQSDFSFPIVRFLVKLIRGNAGSAMGYNQRGSDNFHVLDN